VTDDEKPRTRWHQGEMPGPFGRSFWRSPIRGPWLTSVLGLILLAGVSVVFVTGLLSYAAYNPDLNRINDETHGKGLLGFYLFSWPTHPVWLYRVNQGLHVTLGLVLIPILLAKLWSVLPKLFEWPPLRSPAHALERLSLLLLVGGIVFEFVTGVLNIQQWYKFPGSFYTLHFYGAWVFVAGLVVHTGLKSRTVIRSLRTRGLLRELRIDTAHTEPEPPDASDLVSPAPAAPTISRRGALAFAGAGSLVLLALSAGKAGPPATRPAVADSCGGIPEADLACVFDPAWRGTRDRGPGPDSGTGLGLAIVRGIVEAHQGQVSVVNTKAGCRFEVRLPTLAGSP
jgi:DMSO/TMAO reductase YedYZ molybdopterin-dependent catalytic subunit